MNRPLLLFSVFYAAALVSLSSLRPLWLDEVLQLIGTRAYSGAALIEYVRGFPGAAPLGYMVQHWAIAILGFSLLAARLPSALFAVPGCIVLWRLAPARNRWIVLLLWAVLPLQLRYALEARPYSQGLFFTMLATACLFNLLSRPSLARAAAYTVALGLAIYSVPYTLFLQAGYVAWLLFERKLARESILAAGALALAAASYLPWYLASVPHWRSALIAGQVSGLNLSAKFFLLPIREISGGGYVGSLALIALAGLGCFASSLDRASKGLLLTGVAAGLFGAILTDALFGYFFAIRQVMFILVPLVILAAHAVSEPRFRIATGLMAGALFFGGLVTDFRYLSDRSENWALAAAALHSVAGQGACLKFLTSGDADLYEFFDPSLNSHSCAGAASIAIPSHRYTDPATLRKALAELARGGYEKTGAAAAGGTNILVSGNGMRPISPPI